MEKTERLNRPIMALDRRGLLLGASTLITSALLPFDQALALGGPSTSSLAPLPLSLSGRLVQSGYIHLKVAPRSKIAVNSKVVTTASAQGYAYIGLDRDQAASLLLEVTSPEGGIETKTLEIAPTSYDTQSVDGLPPETVTPTDPAIIKRIQADALLKSKAFQSEIDADWFKGGFIPPLKTFTVTGHFGNQRILNGTPKSPHMGYDMAAPEGTPIYAPQKGKVVLAEPDLFYEGGLILIDHGQGLISMYLHQSKLLVKTGQIVKQGQKIGRVGAKGRATGPHLCWRLKWRDCHMDPSLMLNQSLIS